jgi:glucokinase
LAIGVSNVIHAFDPDIVVLGGGVLNAADLILEPLRDEVDTLLMPDFQGGCRIERAALGDDGGLWGAYALARKLVHGSST